MEERSILRRYSQDILLPPVLDYLVVISSGALFKLAHLVDFFTSLLCHLHVMQFI